MPSERSRPDPALLRRAGEILGLPPERLLFETGCLPGCGVRRLEGALAELEAAIFLAGQGFSNVRLLPASDRLTADLAAQRGGMGYALEVRRVGAKSSLCAGKRPPGRVLAAKVAVKLRQAAATRKRGKLARGGVVLVLAAGCPGEPLALAREAWEGAGEPAAAHVCVLAGGRGGVWPPWP